MYPSLSSNDLITVSEFLEIKGLSNPSLDDTAFYSSNISKVCRSVEEYCFRRFSKTYWINYTAQPQMVLKSFPINNIVSFGTIENCFQISDNSNKITYSISQPSEMFPNKFSGMTINNLETLEETTISFQSVSTVGLLKTELTNVLSGYNVSVTDDANSFGMNFDNFNTFLLYPSMGKQVKLCVDNTLKSSTPPNGYSVNTRSNRLLFSNDSLVNNNIYGYQMALGSVNTDLYGTGGINSLKTGTVDRYMTPMRYAYYSAGWNNADVPATLKLACANILYDLYTQIDQRNGIKSESLGDYSYTLDDNYQVNNLIEKYRNLLLPYINKEF